MTRKASATAVILGILMGVSITRAWVSVGLDSEAGYVLWNHWPGIGWAAGPSVRWHAGSGFYGLGISASFGQQYVEKTSGRLEYTSLKALASIRITPRPFLFFEAAAGYGLFANYIYYDHIVNDLIIESTLSDASALAEIGLGGRFTMGRHLAAELAVKNTFAFAFSGYWNPSASVGLTFDFERGKRREIVAKPKFVFTSDVDTIDPKTGVAPDPDAIAVLFGASNYQHKDVVKVEYAIRDMHVVREYLVKVLGYEEQNVYTIPDPTLSDLATWFGTQANPQGKLSRKAAVMENPKVFVYYSGHGVPSISTGDPYLVPVNCDPNYPEQGGYALKQLYANLEALRVKEVTVVIDACFSGASPEGSLLKDASPLIMEPIEFRAQTPSEFTVLTAAGGRQVANWLPEQRHGLFTYYFLKGLRGDADDGDNELTWRELKNYVVREVSRAAADQDREQTPVFAGDESRVLTKWKQVR